MLLTRPVTALLDLAFPPRCVACGSPTVDRSGERAFCEPCEAELPRFDSPCCLRCGMPAPAEGQPPEDCPTCRQERWAFDEVVALGPYEDLLRHLVLAAKRDSGGRASEALGRSVANEQRERLADEQAVAVVATPIHWTRRVARGVNSADRIAEGVARALATPRRDWLRRTRRTPRQTEVAPSDRPANVRGAFAGRIPASAAGKTILLVDDVLTTGSTCSAAARALKRAGAGRVVAVVAARRVGGA